MEVEPIKRKATVQDRCNICMEYYNQYGIMPALKLCGHCYLNSQKKPCDVCGKQAHLIPGESICVSCNDFRKMRETKNLVETMCLVERYRLYFQWKNKMTPNEAINLWKALKLDVDG